MQTTVETENGFKETEIGSIPDDWGVLRLANEKYFKIIKSGIEPFVDTKEYLSTKSIQGWNVVQPECLIEFDDRPSRANMQPILNSVWFAKMINTIKVYSFTLNNKNELGKYILSTGFCGVLTRKDIILPEYLLFVFLTQLFNSIKNAYCYGVTQKAINNDNIKRIAVPYPPIYEQYKITFVLSKIQQAIEQQDKIIETTRNLKKSVMQKLFTEGIGHTEFKDSEIGEIPKTWDVDKFEELAKIRKETILPKDANEEKYIGLQHLDAGITKIRTHGYPSSVKSLKFRFYSGDILYGKLRPYLDKVALAESSGICSTDIMVMKATDKTDATFLVNRMHLHDFVEYSKSTMTGVNHPRTSWSAISRFKIARPSLDEQKEIAYIMRIINNKNEIDENKKSILEQLFRTMLNKLITGKIRVNDLDIGVNNVN